MSKPPNGTNNALIFPFLFKEGWICVVLVRFWARINGKPRPIWSSIWRDVAEMDVVFFNKVRCEASLTEVYFHNARVDQPLKVSTKKPFHSAHIFDR